MAKISRQVGTTSLIVQVEAWNLATGAPFTGLLYNTAGLSAYYMRNSANADVAVTLATMTLGTFTSGGFREIDSTNMPGLYQLCIPNTALATGADSVVVLLQGVTNLRVLPLEIELTATNNQDGVRGGMTALPNAPTQVKKNQALNGFQFPMWDGNGNPVTGLGTTITCLRSQDGGALGPTSNGAAEIGNGVYTINLTATDTNCGTLGLLFINAAAKNTFCTIVTQA